MSSTLGIYLVTDAGVAYAMSAALPTGARTEVPETKAFRKERWIVSPPVPFTVSPITG